MKIINYYSILILLLITTNCNSQIDGTAKGIDNTPIYYRTFGSGKPLLIINGGPGMNSNGFEELATKLSKNNQTIIYDQRGTGKSILKKLDSTTITIDLMLEDMERLRKELNIEKWSILGHSFGGMLASCYATKYPKNIDKLILSSSGGIDLGLLNYVRESINSKLSKIELDSLAYWNKKIEAGDTSHSTRLGRGRSLAPAYLYNKKYIPILAERLTQGNATINQLIWNNLQKINFDCTEKLKTFNNQVLIIQGRQDIIQPETAEKAQKVFKKSKVVYMDHCGHYGWLDNEKVYFEEINAVLTKSN